MKGLLVIWVIVLLVSSCYREEISADDTQVIFELGVTPAVQEFIYESRDTSYSIEDPYLQLTFNDEPVEIKDIRIRGNSALRFQRKSYSVSLKNSINISNRDGAGTRSLKRFKLLAMAMDYTYIENRIGLGLLEVAGIMPLFFRFVEVKINGDTQGVYMLIEDPEEFFEDQGSEFILRRGYNHGIDDMKYTPSIYFRPEEEYVTRFEEIYSSLPVFVGNELHDILTDMIDLDQYFRKMGVDYLLQNGDYTDEIYLYAMINTNGIQYKVIPWDYDDLFSDHPHETAVSWGTGTMFGKRYYESVEDIYIVIGDKLVYSIEDDLDYIIARDSFMYVSYEDVIRNMMLTWDRSMLTSLFDQIEAELLPFYSDQEIISQSNFDKEPTSLRLWKSNMTEKKALLEERMESMKSQLNIE